MKMDVSKSPRSDVISVEFVIVDEFIEFAEFVKKFSIGEPEIREKLFGVDPPGFGADRFDASDGTTVEGDDHGVAFNDAVENRASFVSQFTGANGWRIRSQGHGDVVAHVLHNATGVDPAYFRTQSSPTAIVELIGRD